MSLNQGVTTNIPMAEDQANETVAQQMDDHNIKGQLLIDDPLRDLNDDQPLLSGNQCSTTTVDLRSKALDFFFRVCGNLIVKKLTVFICRIFAYFRYVCDCN